jgi:hypothetical protein
MLFEKVRLFIESIGPVTMEATKTQVSFGTTRKFAWVWLPQIYTKKTTGKQYHPHVRSRMTYHA